MLQRPHLSISALYSGVVDLPLKPTTHSYLLSMVPQALPRLGLGMAALGRPGYINLDRSAILGTERTIDTMQSQANTVMDQLFQHPNAWLDCARSYGLSERFVGEYLRSSKIKPDDIYVSSKWGYTYVADWNIELGEGEPHEVKDHSMEVSECLSVVERVQKPSCLL